jgi:hypothetical protein
MILSTLTKRHQQRSALESTGIRTVEDLIRTACDNTSASEFTVGLDRVFKVCNERLSHLIVSGEDLKRDTQVTIHGKRPDTMVTFRSAHSVEYDVYTDLIPPEWFCPLTHKVFVNPVIISDGYTYEETAIKAWLQRNNTSPMTSGDIALTTPLIPNRSMRDWIHRLS